MSFGSKGPKAKQKEGLGLGLGFRVQGLGFRVLGFGIVIIFGRVSDYLVLGPLG